MKRCLHGLTEFERETIRKCLPDCVAPRDLKNAFFSYSFVLAETEYNEGLEMLRRRGALLYFQSYDSYYLAHGLTLDDMREAVRK